MQLKFGLLADYVSRGERGKLVIVGEFDHYFTSDFPAELPRFFLFARIEATVAEGTEHELKVELFDADGQRPLGNPPVIPLRFGNRGPGRPFRAQLITEFAGLPIQKPGDYAFHLVVDRLDIGTVPLSVTMPPE